MLPASQPFCQLLLFQAFSFSFAEYRYLFYRHLLYKFLKKIQK
uniref:Uncharacterized protein n=1 Tax=uncultured bacterium contig00003 TaxID=1181495 RepID=A0A806KBL1_9BACT|nr:hypothetical protein [uncultured bacterium contig00003]